jgi:hypothetical protein
MIQVSLVPSEHIVQVWDVVLPMIEDALRYTGGRFTIRNVLADLMTGNQSLWVAIEDGKIIGCTTISVTQYPGLKALVYEHLGGENVARWLEEGHRICSQYGKELGCTMLECQGRSGWKPFLEKLGYRQYAVRYECKIED